MRKTTTQTQQSRSDTKIMSNHEKKAFKRATTRYAEEKAKPKGLSAQKVCDEIEAEYQVTFGQRRIQTYVKNGEIGTSPRKTGNPGTIADYIFQLLCTATESFMKINQLNGQNVKNTRKKLSARVIQVMGKEKNVSMHLIDRILKETAVDILSKVCDNVEDRRVRWTTYNNLKSWFDNWARDLEDLGFAVRNELEELYIPEEQLARILNLDESCLSMDGSNGQRGGRPEAVFYSPNLPQTGRATSKSSLTTTFITGSTAAGEALPPHFQFSTKAQTIETEKLRTAFCVFMPQIRGKFGNDEEKLWPVTFGMNPKGGMDEAEFEKYLSNSIFPLYPDVKDVMGKRVMLKVDSGPGRLNMELLARCRLLGFVLYPGVPNTTAVTQETDKNYGPFKTSFRTILDIIVQNRINAEKSTSLQPWIVGLVVFGGTDPVTKINVEKNAFQDGFSVVACLAAWQKVGAAPLTRKCLEDKQVRRTIGDAEDEMNELMRAMNATNEWATYTLTMMVRPITKLHSLER